MENEQSGETPSPYLDSEIWSNIPDHLLEQVLLRLPLSSLLRFYSVRKSWQVLISSSDFLEQYSVISKQSPWFLMFTNYEYRDGSVYDPISRSWFHIPLPNLPLTERYIPVAAAGGLICFCASTATAGQKKFIVCNLLTRSWRRLPPMLNNPSYLETVGMIVDQQAKFYTIVVAGIREVSVDDIVTEVYESAGDYWKMSNPMPRGVDPLLATIFCDGMLYTLCCKPDGLVAYDILRHTWRLIHIPEPEGLVSNTIMECKGRILLVAGLQEGNVTKTICVWELQKKKHEWIEIDRMPEFLCQDFLDGCTHFMCVGTSDILLLYIGGRLKEMPILYHLGSKNVLLQKGNDVSSTLGGIDLNNSGSVVVCTEKKLLTVLFPVVLSL